MREFYGAIPLKRQMFSLIRGRLPMPSWLYQHLHFIGPFTVEIDRSHRFQMLSHGAVVENELFWAGFSGSWERTSLAIWAAICRDATGTILDVGANTGTYALAAAALAPQSQIIAFEPVERIAELLRRNVALNRFDITVEQMAVSDRQDTIPIYDNLDPINYSASIEGQGADATRYDVPVTSLDAYLLPDRLVTAIKIDVERHEPAVVRGMLKILADHRPPVLIEILDASIGERVADAVAPLDYRFYHIAEARGLIPAERLAPLGKHDWNHLLSTSEDFERLALGRFLAN
jgi:FkbM family methyltransferase